MFYYAYLPISNRDTFLQETSDNLNVLICENQLSFLPLEELTSYDLDKLLESLTVSVKL